MTPTNEPSKGEPLDALVAEVTVADVVKQDSPADDYPYAVRIQPMQLSAPLGVESTDFRIGFFRFQRPAPAQYMVPKRFGMSAILGIMTALAILFGCFRLLNAPPSVYLFFGLQTLVICFAQMFNGKTPRLASSVAGAILVPIFCMPLIAAGTRHFGREGFLTALVGLLIFGVPIGAFLGYLTGTCAAGIFLVMDYLEPYLQWQGSSSRSANV